MSILNGKLRVTRLILPLSVALSAAASWAAVSVTEVSVSQVGNNTVLSYRLNEPATSVSIVAGGQTYAGGTAKGLNTVSLPSGISGGATITATAAAEAGGAAGGVILVPQTNPRDAADATAPQIVGIAVNKREASPYYGRIYVAFGPSQTVKRLDSYSTDGAPLQKKDLTFQVSGSWPYGMALAQGDSLDRILLANRSATKWKVMNPDMSQGAEYTANYCVPGMQVTPNTDPFTKETAPWNIYGSDNLKSGGTRHCIANLVDQTGWAVVNDTEAQPAGTANNMDPHGLAIDPTNQVLFKTIVSDGGVGSITVQDQGTAAMTTTNISKWTSPKDSSVSWTRDDAWGNTLVADIKASLGDGTVDPAGLNPGGIALDKGFDADNLANSKVWIAISGTYTPAGGTAGNINKLYHVRADNGHIISADTIDLQTIGAVAPATTGPMYNRAGHYIDVTGAGNIAVTLNNGISLGVISPNAPRWFAVIAPNTTGPTTATYTLDSLVPPLTAVAISDHPTIGNTGSAVVTYTVTVSDSAGIVADGVQVKANLTQIGGSAEVALTRGAVAADGKSAPYTTTYTIPTASPLGTFDIPFAVSATSTNLTVSATQTVYNAYTPKWVKDVDGAVNSSPAANGTIAYIGTDNGKVYAYNAASSSGDALASFGTGGVVTVPEPVKGKLVFGNGKLYVPGTNHVYILNGRTGETLGVSPSIPNPVIAVQRYSSPVEAAFVGGSDNKIHAIDGVTGAALSAVSADLGAAVLNIEIGPSSATAPNMLVVGCLAADSTGKNGKVVMLRSNDLTAAFVDGSFNPLVYTDPNGPVQSRPVFSKLTDGTNFYAVGVFSGLAAASADTGAMQTWVVGGGGGANVGGNPYTTAYPVVATPGIAQRAAGEPTITFATTNGAVYQIFSGNADPAGQRLTFGGWPVAITAPGTGGFALGSGTVVQRGYETGTTNAARFAYMGSDANDKRFFGLDELPDDISYTAKGAKTHIFDPNDTATFPGYTPGAFNSTPVVTDGTVVVGTDSGKVYGFPTLQDLPPYVVSVTPAVGATGVSTSGTTISITYNADIDTFSLAPEKVALVLNGALVDATLGTGADAKTVTITPNAALTANKWYTVLASGLTDAAGLPVEPFSSSFYTGIPVVTVVKGDVNGDKTFNSADVKAALQIAAGLVSANSDAMKAGDLYSPGAKTPDGKITIEDALFLSRVLAGKDALP